MTAGRTLDGVHDLVRSPRRPDADEVAAREKAAAGFRRVAGGTERPPRPVRSRIAGDERWLAIEDVARYRDGVGIAPPVGIPAAFLGPAVGALDGLLARWARTHGPFLTPDPARRWGLPIGVVGDALERLLAAGSLLRGEFRPGGAEREWCDPEVLRLLRRRSLARLRREVEPVDPAALGRFLPDWQGVAPVGAARPPLRGTAALERLAEVVDQLAGLPIPASVLERDVLPARIPGYQPRLLDELGALGEVAWVGRGSLGRDDGRIALVRPGREILRPIGPPDGVESPAEPRHAAIREHLASRGASFYRELFTAARGTRTARSSDALWDLVWAGEVTNDTFAPLRALRWKRTASGGRRGGGRGRLTALGPPEAAGRWSLVAPETAPASPTERLHAQSLALLERHGVLTREAVATEGIEGGFAAVYPVLRAMEDAGRIRRGYFVDGLGAAQFALAGALDRLRSVREPADPAASGAVHLLAAADPANPYGAALAWPRRGETDRRPLQRAAGAYVVLVDGVAALYLERGGHHPDPPRGRRSGRGGHRGPGLPGACDRRAHPGARPAQGRWRGCRGLAVPADAARGRLRGRLPWANRPSVPIARSGPECPKATRSSGPRPDSGRTSSAGPSSRHGPAGPAPSRRSGGSSGARSPRSRRSARTS